MVFDGDIAGCEVERSYVGNPASRVNDKIGIDRDGLAPRTCVHTKPGVCPFDRIDSRIGLHVYADLDEFSP